MTAAGSKSSSPIRVLVLEAAPVVREGLTQWLGRHPSVELCGQVDAPKEMRAALTRCRPGVVLMDAMPGGTDGVSFIKEMVAEHPTLRILVFSEHDERLYAERVLRAGAAGFVSRNATESEVLLALHTVAAGDLYVSPRLSLLLLGRLLRPTQKPGEKNGVASLTDRELHVFQLLGSGLGVKEIGSRLGVSVKTVQAHRENIKNKLGYASATELARHAAVWVTRHAADPETR